MPDEEIKTPCYYIAGPMRGHPQFNFPAFDEAEATLKRDYAIDAINPARMDREIGFDPDKDTPDAAFLRKAFARDVIGILNADAVLALPGWETSRGAVAEVMICDWLGKPVYRYAPQAPEADRIRQIEKPLEYLKTQPKPPITDPLVEALRITKGDRQQDYGHPREDFSRVAGMWNEILTPYIQRLENPRLDIPAKAVALCMIALKISREVHKPKDDNWADMAGYTRCGWLCK